MTSSQLASPVHSGLEYFILVRVMIATIITFAATVALSLFTGAGEDDDVHTDDGTHSSSSVLRLQRLILASQA